MKNNDSIYTLFKSAKLTELDNLLLIRLIKIIIIAVDLKNLVIFFKNYIMYYNNDFTTNLTTVSPWLVSAPVMS